MRFSIKPGVATNHSFHSWKTLKEDLSSRARIRHDESGEAAPVNPDDVVWGEMVDINLAEVRQERTLQEGAEDRELVAIDRAPQDVREEVFDNQRQLDQGYDGIVAPAPVIQAFFDFPRQEGKDTLPPDPIFRSAAYQEVAGQLEDNRQGMSYAAQNRIREAAVIGALVEGDAAAIQGLREARTRVAELTRARGFDTRDFVIIAGTEGVAAALRVGMDHADRLRQGYLIGKSAPVADLANPPVPKNYFQWNGTAAAKLRDDLVAEGLISALEPRMPPGWRPSHPLFRQHQEAFQDVAPTLKYRIELALQSAAPSSRLPEAIGRIVTLAETATSEQARIRELHGVAFIGSNSPFLSPERGSSLHSRTTMGLEQAITSTRDHLAAQILDPENRFVYAAELAAIDGKQIVTATPQEGRLIQRIASIVNANLYDVVTSNGRAQQVAEQIKAIDPATLEFTKIVPGIALTYSNPLTLLRDLKPEQYVRNVDMEGLGADARTAGVTAKGVPLQPAPKVTALPEGAPLGEGYADYGNFRSTAIVGDRNFFAAKEVDHFLRTYRVSNVVLAGNPAIDGAVKTNLRHPNASEWMRDADNNITGRYPETVRPMRIFSRDFGRGRLGLDEHVKTVVGNATRIVVFSDLELNKNGRINAAARESAEFILAAHAAGKLAGVINRNGVVVSHKDAVERATIISSELARLDAINQDRAAAGPSIAALKWTAGETETANYLAALGCNGIYIVAKPTDPATMSELLYYKISGDKREAMLNTPLTQIDAITAHLDGIKPTVVGRINPGVTDFEKAIETKAMLFEEQMARNDLVRRTGQATIALPDGEMLNRTANAMSWDAWNKLGAAKKAELPTVYIGTKHALNNPDRPRYVQGVALPGEKRETAPASPALQAEALQNHILNRVRGDSDYGRQLLSIAGKDVVMATAEEAKVLAAATEVVRKHAPNFLPGGQGVTTEIVNELRNSMTKTRGAEHSPMVAYKNADKGHEWREGLQWAGASR